MSDILIQMRYEGFQQPGNPLPVYIGLGVVVVVVILIVIINRLRARATAIKSGKGSAAYNKRMFKRKAKELGLAPPHIGTLLHLVSQYNVKNPFALLTNSPLLDTVLKKGLREIESQVASNEVKEAEKLTIFHIKQIIERNSQRKTVYSTTRQLKVNQPVSITPETGQRYSTYVTGNLKDYLGVKAPLDDKGNQLRWRKWMPVKAFFFKDNGQGYSFTSKAMGYNMIKGTASLLLQHSNSITQAQQRRYRRKDIEKPAYFYKVQIMSVGVGKEVRKKAYVDQKKSALGTILDISAGGCSIRTNFPLGKGELVKVEFETERRIQVNVFGKVKSVRRIKPVGGVMHIMFTRVSKQSLNRINTFIYDYEDTSGRHRDNPSVQARLNRSSRSRRR